MIDHSAHPDVQTDLSSPVITLPPLLDLEAASRLKHTIVELRAGPAWTVACRCIRIEADQAENLSTPALQVLLAWERDAASAGVRLEWGPASPAFAEAVRLAGARWRLDADVEGEGCRRPF